ncbi:MAG: hypothetical protein MUE90_06820 [Thermoanaerobaculales bacterium]|nr:hypothetical protein [Thermoanaerobaculales bacterium]
MPGNHDMNYLAPDDAESLLSFRRHFGPAYYSFDYGRTHVVVLDTVEYLGTSRGAADADPLGAGSYRGAIGERQLAWLAACTSPWSPRSIPPRRASMSATGGGSSSS